MERHSAAFAQLSRELLAQKEEVLTWDRIAELAVNVVPSADAIGVSLRRRGGSINTVAFTDSAVARADELQYALEEGPCLDSIRDAEACIAHDTRSDRRWPRWGPLVAELGFLSVLSVQLVDFEAKPLGAVNLYARAANIYTDEDVDYALVFAHHAAGAIESSGEIDGLRAALHSRHEIGVAQGMLMQRYGLSLDRAFELLVRRSQGSNTKIRDIASLMVRAGQIPDVPAQEMEQLQVPPPSPN